VTKQRHLERQAEAIARWIIWCEHLFAFAGAVISTDSGIPDLRGPADVGVRLQRSPLPEGL
jgi:NAD-dependent SIR2 family protein deacetylase